MRQLEFILAKIENSRRLLFTLIPNNAIEEKTLEATYKELKYLENCIKNLLLPNGIRDESLNTNAGYLVRYTNQIFSAINADIEDRRRVSA